MSLALTDLPTGRTAPPEIVRALKEVDPTAELVYMGDRRWDLLRLRPKNDARAKVAFGMLMNAYRACEKGHLAEAGWYRALRFARLLRQGYIVFGRYHLDRDPDAKIVREFRRAVWEYTHDRNDQEIEYRWNAKERELERKRAAFGDLDLAREATRAARNRVNFTVNGLKGVA